MKKEVKLHLGCGTVYLDGWTNIDVFQKDYTFLASDEGNKNLLEYNRTTLDKYYKYPWGTRKKDFTVVDMYLDLTSLPYKEFEENSVDSILAINLLEHFGPYDAPWILKQWLRILKPWGTLTVDVPDLYGILKILKDSKCSDDDLWAIRLLYGTQKNPYSFHKWGYTYCTLKDTLNRLGVKDVKAIDDFVHREYPVIVVEAKK